MAFGNQKTSVPVAVQGSLENPMVQSIENNGIMQLVLTADSLTWGDDGKTIEVSLPVISKPSIDFLPILFNVSLTNAMGSTFYPASFRNGILTIKKDGNENVIGSGFKYFTKVTLCVLGEGAGFGGSGDSDEE